MYVNSRAIIERAGERETEVFVQVRDRPGAGGVLELPGGTLNEHVMEHAPETFSGLTQAAFAFYLREHNQAP